MHFDSLTNMFLKLNVKYTSDLDNIKEAPIRDDKFPHTWIDITFEGLNMNS